MGGLRASVSIAWLLAACGGGARGYLAGAPREADLAEPAVDEATLRADKFGYGGGSTELALARCDAPLEYALGEIDPRFELGRKQALRAIGDAAKIWARAAGRPMFRYSPRSRYVIDFVFDERQEMAIQRATKPVPSDELHRRYDALEATHTAALAAYEQRRVTYDDTVARWNDQGGAPDDERRALDAEQAALTAERLRVDAMLPRIEALAAEINSRGRDADHRAYPHMLAGWTDTETAGDVITGLHTDIYLFATWKELTLIVAHELGHALGLQHTASQTSVMYGGPDPKREGAATADDLAELGRACP